MDERMTHCEKSLPLHSITKISCLFQFNELINSVAKHREKSNSVEDELRHLFHPF